MITEVLSKTLAYISSSQCAPNQGYVKVKYVYRFGFWQLTASFLVVLKIKPMQAHRHLQSYTKGIHTYRVWQNMLSIEILFYLFCIHVTKSCSICLARDDVIADMYLYRYLVCMGKTTQLLGINFPNKRIPKHLCLKKKSSMEFLPCINEQFSNL